MQGLDREDVLPWHLSQRRLRLVGPPGPGVAKPQARQDVQAGGLWCTIAQADQDQNVGRRPFCVLHKHIEISIVLKDACVQ